MRTEMSDQIRDYVETAAPAISLAELAERIEAISGPTMRPALIGKQSNTAKGETPGVTTGGDHLDTAERLSQAASNVVKCECWRTGPLLAAALDAEA